jgi:soluble lytic murein transglycosylase-like protein
VIGCCALAVIATLVAPPPDAPVPTTPRALAASLTATDRALRDDPAPEALELHVLYLQRSLRLLSRHPPLAARTLPRLGPRLRANVRDVTTALRNLRRLSAGWPPHKIRTGDPEPLERLRSHYAAAQRRFGVGAHVLAAVNLVESDFGRLRNNSVAGAQGPMQFMPATWRTYGLGGDIQDPHDAILGAANLLRQNGAPRDYARALYRYNPSPLYVDAVRRYARMIDRDRAALRVLYHFQVFVRTRGGERRLTGPGAKA